MPAKQQTPAPKGPPKFVPVVRPKQPSVHPIERDFFADPFDPRFVEGECLTDRRLNPLGMLVQTYGYLRARLKDVCPDALDFIEEHST